MARQVEVQGGRLQIRFPLGVTGFFSLIYPSGRTVARADSASNRNGYRGYVLGDKGGRCVRLTTLLPSCADCLKFWDLQPAGALRACPGLYRDTFTFTYQRDSHNLTFPRLHPTSCSVLLSLSVPKGNFLFSYWKEMFYKL